MAGLAHDILAADAILLFPRLFSVLDHNRYFSQLIIAFRLMATDLVGVSILMIITCSGFFVALTLSFGNQSDDGASVAYALLQMVMGFTPAVWDRWASYTPLGRTILVLFLWLCHFLILTILVAVLSSSFMTVAKNAHEEHQFIFAVNTISSVKSDHLFSFIAPLNVIQWTLSPLRYILPFKQFVKLNRVVIKITHFPILFIIYAYEKTILQSTVVDSVDVVDIRKGARSIIAQHLPKLGAPSVANFRQDQALEEVFKQPFGANVRTDAPGTRNSNTVVNRWMRDIGEDIIRPQNLSNNLSRLDNERSDERGASAVSKAQRSSRKAMSLSSDPPNLVSDAGFFSTNGRIINTADATPANADQEAHEDTGDGDDEMPTNDIEDDRMTIDSRGVSIARPLPSLDYFSLRHSPVTRTPVRAASIRSSSSDSRASRDSHGSRGRHQNSASGYVSPVGLAIRRRPSTNLRNISSATMIYNPPTTRELDTNNEEHLSHPTASNSRPLTPGSKPSSGNSKKTPKSKQASRLREIFPNKDEPSFRSAPDLKSLTHPVPIPDARRASLEMDLVSDLGDNKAIGGGYVGALPASFAKQMTSGLSQLQRENKEEQQMLGRLMMARMNTLEEGFREVIHEMRENLKVASRNRSPERPVQERRERRAAARYESRSFEKFSSSLRDNDSSGSTLFTDPRQNKFSMPNSMNRPQTQMSFAAEKRHEEKRTE